MLNDLPPVPPQEDSDQLSENGLSVPLTTAVSQQVYNALIRYTKDFGHRKPQDVNRIALASFLRKEGYLPS